MVWSCFRFKRKSKFVFVDNKVASQRYTDVFEETLLPFIEKVHTGGAAFQHDSAPVDTSPHLRIMLCQLWRAQHAPQI